MQFGKLHGFGLMVLGVILLALQFALVVPTKNERRLSKQATESASQMRPSPWPGVLGTLAFLAGFGVFIAAGRRDDRASKNAVK